MKTTTILWSIGLVLLILVGGYFAGKSAGYWSISRGPNWYPENPGVNYDLSDPFTCNALNNWYISDTTIAPGSVYAHGVAKDAYLQSIVMNNLVNGIVPGCTIPGFVTPTGTIANPTYVPTANTPTTTPTPTAAPTGWAALLAQIIEWLKGVWTALKALFTYSIAGQQSVTPGTAQTYQITLAEPYPLRSDYSQGVFMQRWCSVALLDKNNNILNEIPFETCTGTWTKTYTVNIPAGNYADYVIIAGMAETRQDYTNGAWTIIYQDKIVQKESISLTSKVIIAPNAASKPSGWSAFWNWLLNLFR